MRFLYCLTVWVSFFLVLTSRGGRAQAPAWGGATAATAVGSGASSQAMAAATDDQGNVFVTGYFSGQVAFGGTVLTSAGRDDLFVAKWVPGSGTWAWVVRGGGTSVDQATGIAVSGNAVYVTGFITNTGANSAAVQLTGTNPAAGSVPVPGSGSSFNADLLLARYTDNGTTATINWAQVAGGNGEDYGQAVAANGSSVYVTGAAFNTIANGYNVFFRGGAGGTLVPVRGASDRNSQDIVLAKYQANGTLSWVQVAGGTNNDYGHALAVSGTSVYVAGYLNNNFLDTNVVVFGGDGTTLGTQRQLGACYSASADVFVAKFSDQGAAGSYQWSHVGGGIYGDAAYGVAVRGTSVYVASAVVNNRANAASVNFGGTGTTIGSQPQYGAGNSSDLGTDVVLAKYTDNGSTGTLGWTQVAGGTAYDMARAVMVQGTSVLVAGYFINNAANDNQVVAGGSGVLAGTTPVAGVSATVGPDVALMRYTDNGPTATYNSTLLGGGPGSDISYGLAVSGQQVYVAGHAVPPATFGAITLASSASTTSALLAYLTDPALPLPTRAAGPGPGGLALYPNPAPGATQLSGASPATAVQVLDALGRVVATATTNSTGTATLARLAPGLYLVRAGAAAARLAVE